MKPLNLVVGLILLALLCFFCVYTHAPRIQAELLEASSEGLRTVQLADPDGIQLTVDGREVAIRGVVASADERQRAVAAVREVWGVRTVDDRLSLAAVASGTAARESADGTSADGASADGTSADGTDPGPSLPAEDPLFFELERSGDAGDVVLRGILASEAQRESVVQSAAEIFGGDRIEDRLAVDSERAAPWQASVALLVGRLRPAWTGGRLRIEDGRLEISGQVLGAGELAGLLDRLKSAGGSLSVVDRLAETAPPPIADVQQDLDVYLSDRTIEFESGSATLTPQGTQILDEVARILYRSPNTAIKIAGHTDTQGEAAFNLDLSKRRAEAVVNYLEQRWRLDRQRLTAEGYGENRPIADNSTSEGRARNRRIEIHLLAENSP